MANYKRGYDKRRGSFCKMCKLGKRQGNAKMAKTDSRIKLEAKVRDELKDVC